MSEISTEKRTRDREATQRRIIEAAKSLLAMEGFQGFGVNAIARAADCDKQLIYKYFGGLDGVVNAIGMDLGEWLSGAMPLPDPGEPHDCAQIVERMIIQYMRALRRDRLVQRIMAWEVSENTPLVRRLSHARTSALRAWTARLVEVAHPPAGVDTAALIALMIGAVQQMVLAGKVSGGFAGLQLTLDADWARVELSIRHMVRAALSGSGGQPDWGSAGISIVSPS
jgi:AcrR family transcriptional regulator